MVKRLGRKAGIVKNVHPHLLRHTFATDLYRDTRNIRLVQKALGHSDLSTTMIYTHVVDEELEGALKSFRGEKMMQDESMTKPVRRLDAIRRPGSYRHSALTHVIESQEKPGRFRLCQYGSGGRRPVQAPSGRQFEQGVLKGCPSAVHGASPGAGRALHPAVGWVDGITGIRNRGQQLGKACSITAE